MFTNLPYGDMKTNELKNALVAMFPYVLSLEKLDKRQTIEIKCLKGKYWEFIVEDLIEQLQILEKSSRFQP